MVETYLDSCVSVYGLPLTISLCNSLRPVFFSVFSRCQGGNNQPTSPVKPLEVKKTRNTHNKPFRGPFFRLIYHITSKFLIPPRACLIGSPLPMTPGSSYDPNRASGRHFRRAASLPVPFFVDCFLERRDRRGRLAHALELLEPQPARGWGEY